MARPPSTSAPSDGPSASPPGAYGAAEGSSHPHLGMVVDHDAGTDRAAGDAAATESPTPTLTWPIYGPPALMTASASPTEGPPPQVSFGKYELLGELGRGGM